MKKIFTLALLLVTVLTASAKSRTWDFTHWSAATVANLMKGLAANCASDAEAVNPASGWSEFQKSSGTIASAEGGKAFYEIKGQGNATEGVTSVTADGQAIQEFDGLIYVNTKARTLGISLNRGLANGHGPQFVWFLSKNLPFFVIPNVKPGAKITLGLESHDPSKSARGVKLYVTTKGKYNTKGTELKDPDGNTVNPPTTYQEQTWLLPEEGLTDTPNEDGTYDIVLYNTDSAHCFFINVDEGDSFDEAPKIAWIGNATPGATVAYASRPDGFDYTDIDGSDAANVTDEALRGYDAVVVDNDVTSETPAYAQLQKNIAFVPMVNLSTKLFGYTETAGETTTMTVTNADDDAWTDLTLDEGTFDYSANVSVTLPGLFADDEVLAKQGDDVAIHRHNNGAGKNSYFLLGSPDEAVGGYGDWSNLLANLMKEAAKSKREVTAAATPTFKLAYGDKQTTVTISCATGGSKIYYKEGDGEYKLYTEPILYTAETTLTAYAESEGFLKSEEATKTVDIQTMTATPTISVEQQDGKSIVTLSGEDGATVYYSFSGQTKTSTAATYAEPVEVTEPGTITFFATAEGKLQSEASTGDIRVKGIPEVTDTLSHFTANEADWFTNAEVSTDGTTFTPLADAITAGTSNGNAKAVYYFGKSAWAYNSDEIDHYEDGTDADGNPVQNPVYKPNADILRVVKSTSDPDWLIESEGQVITGETNVSANSGIYTSTSGNGYYAEAAVDELGGTPSKGKVDFGGKSSGDPYTMRIASTKQFTGTFDVVTYLSNGSTSDLGIELQKSADGKTWETVGKLNYSKTQRLFKKSRFHMDETTPVYLRVAQVSGGSKGQLYDIYVIKTEGTSTAISNVKAEKADAAKVGKFVKNGRIYIQKGDAFYNVAGAQVK